MFRFSILPILCALALTAVVFTVSHVSAHEVETPQRAAVTVTLTYHGSARAGEEGVHTHEWRYADGNTLFAYFSRDQNTIPPNPSVPSQENDPSRLPGPFRYVELPFYERGGLKITIESPNPRLAPVIRTSDQVTGTSDQVTGTSDQVNPSSHPTPESDQGDSGQTGVGSRVIQRDITPDPAVVNPTPDSPVDPVSNIPVTTGTGSGPPAPLPDTTTNESPAGTSGPPQSVVPVATSASQEARPASPPMQPIRVTEYMVRDWSKSIGGNLPQWIELYNPNIEAVNLKGWTFQYATRRFANHPYTIHTLTLAATADGFSIPGGGVAILATQRLPARKFSGIEATQVYNLNVENVLKRGWVLTDAEGKEVQRLGRKAFSALGDPMAPPHQDGKRVSYHAYRSEFPSESYYYGHSGDVGSPGFYKQPAPAAPSLIRPKRVGTWADLKR